MQLARFCFLWLRLNWLLDSCGWVVWFSGCWVVCGFGFLGRWFRGLVAGFVILVVKLVRVVGVLRPGWWLGVYWRCLLLVVI